MRQTRRQFVQGLGVVVAAGCGDDSSTTPPGTSGADGGGAGGNGGTSSDGGAQDATTDSPMGDGGPTGIGEGSPFGIATSHSRSLNLGWLTTIGTTGIAWLRGFDRDNADKSLSDALAAGFEVSGILQQGAAFPAGDLNAWRDGVKQLVTEAKGRVKYWEVWNEPPNFSTDKTPESYAAIVKSAYDAVKEVDPTLQVGLCSASVHLSFMSQAIVAGAADHFDYITLHPYETLDLVDRGFEGQFMGIVPTVRKMLAELNPAKQWVPVVFTELGEPVDGSHTPEHQAATFLKAYVLSIAQGVTRIHWFEGIDGDSGPFGLLADDGTPRPSFTAAKVLIENLGALPKYLGWVLLDGAHYGFVFDGPSGPLLVAWPAPGTSPTIAFGKTVDVVDPLTGSGSSGSSVPLSAPLIVRQIPAALVNEAANDKGAPFWWGGDFSGAKEISFTPNAEQGLHVLGAAPTITLGGDLARDCGSAAAHSFTLDPNFNTWDTVPLRVTAVVRRTTNGAAGFNLKYESAAGTKSTGSWNGVPAQDQWHTLTWDVTDARFVGKWGYHLSLDSDSTDNSQYALKSLTITKL